MTIHAYAALAASEALSAFKYEPPDLQPQEVEVAITHCGICHSDIHLIDNDWGFSSYPLMPGHEIVGKISAAGAVVAGLFPGQRVGIGRQRSSCMACEWYLEGRENCCPANQATCVGRHRPHPAHRAPGPVRLPGCGQGRRPTGT